MFLADSTSDIMRQVGDTMGRAPLDALWLPPWLTLANLEKLYAMLTTLRNQRCREPSALALGIAVRLASSGVRSTSSGPVTHDLAASFNSAPATTLSCCLDSTASSCRRHCACATPAQPVSRTLLGRPTVSPGLIDGDSRRDLLSPLASSNRARLCRHRRDPTPSPMCSSRCDTITGPTATRKPSSSLPSASTTIERSWSSSVWAIGPRCESMQA